MWFAWPAFGFLDYCDSEAEGFSPLIGELPGLLNGIPQRGDDAGKKGFSNLVAELGEINTRLGNKIEEYNRAAVPYPGNNPSNAYKKLQDARKLKEQTRKQVADLKDNLAKAIGISLLDFGQATGPVSGSFVKFNDERRRALFNNPSFQDWLALQADNLFKLRQSGKSADELKQYFATIEISYLQHLEDRGEEYGTTYFDSFLKRKDQVGGWEATTFPFVDALATIEPQHLVPRNDFELSGIVPPYLVNRLETLQACLAEFTTQQTYSTAASGFLSSESRESDISIPQLSSDANSLCPGPTVGALADLGEPAPESLRQLKNQIILAANDLATEFPIPFREVADQAIKDAELASGPYSEFEDELPGASIFLPPEYSGRCGFDVVLEETVLPVETGLGLDDLIYAEDRGLSGASSALEQFASRLHPCAEHIGKSFLGVDLEERHLDLGRQGPVIDPLNLLLNCSSQLYQGFQEPFAAVFSLIGDFSVNPEKYQCVPRSWKPYVDDPNNLFDLGIDYVKSIFTEFGPIVSCLKPSTAASVLCEAITKFAGEVAANAVTAGAARIGATAAYGLRARRAVSRFLKDRPGLQLGDKKELLERAYQSENREDLIRILREGGLGARAINEISSAFAGRTSRGAIYDSSGDFVRTVDYSEQQVQAIASIRDPHLRLDTFESAVRLAGVAQSLTPEQKLLVWYAHELVPTEIFGATAEQLALKRRILRGDLSGFTPEQLTAARSRLGPDYENLDIPVRGEGIQDRSIRSLALATGTAGNDRSLFNHAYNVAYDPEVEPNFNDLLKFADQAYHSADWNITETQRVAAHLRDRLKDERVILVIDSGNGRTQRIEGAYGFDFDLANGQITFDAPGGSSGRYDLVRIKEIIRDPEPSPYLRGIQPGQQTAKDVARFNEAYQDVGNSGEKFEIRVTGSDIVYSATSITYRNGALVAQDLSSGRFLPLPPFRPDQVTSITRVPNTGTSSLVSSQADDFLARNRANRPSPDSPDERPINDRTIDPFAPIAYSSGRRPIEVPGTAGGSLASGDTLSGGGTLRPEGSLNQLDRRPSRPQPQPPVASEQAPVNDGGLLRPNDNFNLRPDLRRGAILDRSEDTLSGGGTLGGGQLNQLDRSSLADRFLARNSSGDRSLNRLDQPDPQALLRSQAQAAKNTFISSGRTDVDARQLGRFISGDSVGMNIRFPGNVRINTNDPRVRIVEVGSQTYIQAPIEGVEDVMHFLDLKDGLPE